MSAASEPARDVASGARVTRNWITTAALVVIAICIAGAALAYMRDLLTPLLIAIFLYFLIQPLIETLYGWRLPRWLLYSVLVALPILAALATAWIIDVNVRAFAGRVPLYRAKVITMLEQAAIWSGYAAEGNFNGDEYIPNQLSQESKDRLLRAAVNGTFKVVEIAVLVAFYLLFLFLEARKFRGRVRSGFDPDTTERILGVIDKIDDSIRRYLWIKTVVSLGLGLSTAMLCWLFGLEFWFMWGLLMFLANYITYVGSIAALVPPLALAFLQFGSPLTASILAALLIANRLFWIDYAEIRYSGEHLDVSPLLLLLSIALLGWIWGVVGMLLAVPLVTSTKIVLSHFDNTRHIAMLMSDD